MENHRTRSDSFPWETWPGENELWKYMGFDYSPRSTLTVSELWQGISPSTSVSSSIGRRPHTSPMGCNEDCMKSREKIITSMATHKKSLGSVSPSLASVWQAEENGTLKKNMLTFPYSSASNFHLFDKSKRRQIYSQALS